MTWKAITGNDRPDVFAKTKRELLDELGAWSAHRVQAGHYIVWGEGPDIPDIHLFKMATRDRTG